VAESTGVHVWYRVRNLEEGRAFYADALGFEEAYYDSEGRWARLRRGTTEIGLTEGEPEEGGVATIDVSDAKGEAGRLRAAGVAVGTVLELHGQMRLLDVYDPDGNRIQLIESLEERG
jgi:catechol 2,3-dioxygenase-like lactoylglutathione lyase family enzyme